MEKQGRPEPGGFLIHVRLVEEMVLNESFLPEGMKGWRLYRIEYDGEIEGRIWLPSNVGADYAELIIQRLILKQ